MIRNVTVYAECYCDKWKQDKVQVNMDYQRAQMAKQKASIEELTAIAKKTNGAVGLDDLTTQLSLIKDRFHNICMIFERMVSLKAEGDEAYANINVQKAMDTEIKNQNNYNNDVAFLISSLTDLRRNMAAKKEADVTAEVKFTKHLQPEKLTEKATLSEKRVWRLQYDAFYNSSNFKVATLKEQQQYLMLNLSKTLAANLLRKIEDDWPIYGKGKNNCMAALDDIFSQIHPVYARRNAMLSMRRYTDESYGDWSTRLKNAADEAGISNLTHDEFITMMLVSFSNDTYLDTEFQRLENPTVAQCDAIGSAWDRGENFKADTQQKDAKVYQISRPQQQQPKQKQSKGAFSKFLAGRCARCAGNGHTSPDCQAKNLNCAYCRKPNHVQAVCFTRFQHELKGDKAKARQTGPEQVPPAQPAAQQQQQHALDNVLLSQTADVKLSPEQAAAVRTAVAGGKPANQPTPPLFL